MRNLFVKAATNHEVYEALLVTMRKTSVALNRMMRAGFEFDGNNNVIKLTKLSSDDVEKLDSAVKGILYLHSIEPLWTGHKKAGSVAEKARMIAEFNIMLNEAVAMAM